MVFHIDCRKMLRVEVVAPRGVKIVGGTRVSLSFTKARVLNIFCQIRLIDPFDVLSHMIHVHPSLQRDCCKTKEVKPNSRDPVGLLLDRHVFLRLKVEV